MGYSPCGSKELDMTERLTLSLHYRLSLFSLLFQLHELPRLLASGCHFQISLGTRGDCDGHTQLVPAKDPVHQSHPSLRGCVLVGSSENQLIAR